MNEQVNLICFESRSPSPSPMNASTSAFSQPVNSVRKTQQLRKNTSPSRLFSIATNNSNIFTASVETSDSKPKPVPESATNTSVNNINNTNNVKDSHTLEENEQKNPLEIELDPDSARFHASLQKWSSLLSRAILADYMDAKTLLHEKHVKQVEETGLQYVESVSGLTTRVRDLEAVVDLCREKVEARNLALDAAAGLFEKLDLKRMHLAERVAQQKAKSSAMRRALFGWQRVCGVNWRKVVEKEYPAPKASFRYENEGSINLSLIERAAQGDMKKALMRGVCALNMEAMSVFRPGINGPAYQQQPFIPDFPPQTIHDDISPTSTVGTLLNSNFNSLPKGSEGIDVSSINIQPISRGQRSVTISEIAKMYPNETKSTESGRTSPILQASTHKTITTISLNNHSS
ncbi:hypothetical protein BDR26DRAFT_936197 [Obelidium mucronatum]|nr:hypothetical protein BDR26DRAFT_936197 [Obelidium mucronatum]